MEGVVSTLGFSYLALLSENNLYAEILDPYYLIGAPPEKGWLLHVSVVSTELYALLQVIIPFLKNNNAPFAIPATPVDALNIVYGRYGNKDIGKTICIYPWDDQQALYLATELIKLTKETSGPRVPMERHLGGSVYVSAERLLTVDTLFEEQPNARFKLPEGIDWPFGSLVLPEETKRKGRKLKGKYIVFEVLKADPKGSVIKAIRRVNFFDFKWVIVKAGNMHMCSDEGKQDMRTRLRWQQEVAKRMEGKIRTPKVYEHFEIDGDGYIAMEYIKGKSLRAYIVDSYENKVWINMPLILRIAIIEKVLQIVGIVKELHKMELVHRDLTSMNFILKKDKLYLLDLELVYSLTESYPKPAFGVGSKGYMSPQQEAHMLPTAMEDIFALGALMQKFFTGLDPFRLATTDQDKVKQKMYFFLQDNAMSEMVAACLQVDPLKRPSLAFIKESLTAYVQRMKITPAPKLTLERADNGILNDLVNGGIVSLGNYLLSNGYWASKEQDVKQKKAGNEIGEYMLYGGMNHGASGILYMLCRAQQAGYSIEPCKQVIDTSWQLIHEQFIQLADQREPNLSEGMAGVALNLLTNGRAELLPQGWNLNELLLTCFQVKATTLELFKGLAGQGLAAILCAQKEPGLMVLMPEIINPILSQQAPDGSWKMPVPDAGNKLMAYPGLMNGTSGVVYFLLTCWELMKDENVMLSAKKGLAQLQHDFRRKNKKFVDHTTPPTILFYGLSGVALTFIKAYALLGDQSYKEFAESLLGFMPDKYLFDNLTINHGLAGIGEVYLEAYQVFKTERWLERADYIAQAIMHMALDNQGGYYWLQDGAQGEGATPDLMIGNAGIVHFLIRYLHPGKFGFPMLTA